MIERVGIDCCIHLSPCRVTSCTGSHDQDPLSKGRASRSSFTPPAGVAISNMDKTSSIFEHLFNKGIRSVCPLTPPSTTLLQLAHS